MMCSVVSSKTYLSNRVFESYTAILDACQDAWRKLLAEVGASPPSPRAIGRLSVNDYEGWYNGAFRTPVIGARGFLQLGSQDGSCVRLALPRKLSVPLL
jgi:hypothetical protein